jgi:hypothetical protein
LDALEPAVIEQIIEVAGFSGIFQVQVIRKNKLRWPADVAKVYERGVTDATPI